MRPRLSVDGVADLALANPVFISQSLLADAPLGVSPPNLPHDILSELGVFVRTAVHLAQRPKEVGRAHDERVALVVRVRAVVDVQRIAAGRVVAPDALTAA
jgi:hypothetical protein